MQLIKVVTIGNEKLYNNRNTTMEMSSSGYGFKANTNVTI